MAAVARFLRSYPWVTATLAVLVVVLVCAAAGWPLAARIMATAYVGAFVVYTCVGMVRDMLRGHWGLDILAVVAMLATLWVGEYVAALIVMLMLSGGEALEDAAASRAKADLDALLHHAPQRAVRVAADGTQAEVDAAELLAGDTVLVRPGEVVPVDGRLLEAAEFDLSSLTGESLPVGLGAGDEVASGAVNGSTVVRLIALRAADQSQFQQIVALVRRAQENKAPTVRLADRFALPFTAFSLLLAGGAWALSGDPLRFAQVLVLATPCPLLIAAPVAFLGGLSRASRAGVVVKDGGVLERLGRLRSAAFDKTGTLTAGRPELVAVRPAGGAVADEVLRLAAAAEQASSHVLAAGIIAAAEARGLELPAVDGASEVATNGVLARVEGREVAVGKPAWVASLAPGLERAPLSAGQAAAYVAVDGAFAGTLVLQDAPRPEAAAVTAWLRENGVARQVILTGDVEATAAPVAAGVGITEVHAELLPADKVRLAAELSPRPVVMVGDGVNDAPVLAAADVGVAMGARGATAAGDAADAVILRDSLRPLAEAVNIGRHTLRVALTSIWIGIVLSVGLMLIAATGAIPAVAGALTQELVDLAAILYALRALRPPALALPTHAPGNAAPSESVGP
ncbi:heavy metal translocating P-type ATPase [Galactobacter valiniphilus]|uniref:heavy metal translocating P-type ATPase n=1 Tax=Galactobacter valiniphilus TaxID=2676122 RepID=UPI0037356056